MVFFVGQRITPFVCKAMVDHDQQRVKAGGSGEVGDEVAQDLLERTRCMGFDRGERGDGGVRVHLVLLAHGTAFDVLAHKLRETGPPKLRGDELASLKIVRMTGGLMVMASCEDGTAEGVLRGNIDATLVGQDVVVEFPVREARPEGSGDVF